MARLSEIKRLKEVCRLLQRPNGDDRPEGIQSALGMLDEIIEHYERRLRRCRTRQDRQLADPLPPPPGSLG